MLRAIDGFDRMHEMIKKCTCRTCWYIAGKRKLFKSFQYAVIQIPNHTALTSVLHHATLQYTTLHYTTLHYNRLHYPTLQYITLPYTTLHHIKIHSQHNIVRTISTCLGFQIVGGGMSTCSAASQKYATNENGENNKKQWYR